MVGCSGCALLVIALSLAVVSALVMQFFDTPVGPGQVAWFLFLVVAAGVGGYLVVAAIRLRRLSAARASVRRPGPEAPRPWVP